MGTWKKSPRIAPADEARIQRQIDAVYPTLAQSAREASTRTGRSVGWTDIPQQIRARVGIPDGYDIDLNGKLVYTNKTPLLQQMAWASSPFVAGYAAQGLSGLLAPTAATGTAGAGGAATGLPSYMAAPGVPHLAAGAGGMAETVAGGSVATKGFFDRLGTWLGTPAGEAAVRVGGDLAGGWLQNRALNRGYALQDAYQQRALAEYLKERERDWRIEDEDRAHRYKREGEREARLGPFRAGAERGYQTLSSLLYDPEARMTLSPPVSDAVRRHSLADLMRA